MKATINTALLARLKPKAKPYEVRDDKIIGFLVRVNISGKLLYMCEFARGKRVTIGKVGVLSIVQARDKALSILGDAARGIDPRFPEKKNQCVSLKEFIDNHYKDWITQHRKSAEKTLAHIQRCFGKEYGNKLLIDFTPTLVDQWRTKRLKESKSTETVNRDVATFKAALSKAVLWGLIEKHPLEKLKLLKTDRSGKVRYLSPHEEQSLREAAITREVLIKAKRLNANKWRTDRDRKLYPDLTHCIFTDHLRPMILLSINTGLRRGEIFSLQWNNVNFERALLTIEGSYAKSGKTRHLPLNSEALSVLKSWHKQMVLSSFSLEKMELNLTPLKKAGLPYLRMQKLKTFAGMISDTILPQSL